MWKFDSKISVEDLGEIAKQWSKEDENYIQLYIREVSKDQMGIGFTYRLAEDRDAKEAYRAYFNKTTDFLKRKFGNDLVGWDISSSVWVIKDSNQ